MNKARLLLLFVGTILPSACSMPQGQEREDARFGLIPAPVELERRPARCALSLESKVILSAPGVAGADTVARHVCRWLGRESVYTPPAGLAVLLDPPIVLTTKDATKDLGNEGYILEVAHGKIVIRANQAAGLFYGWQTLRQLAPPEFGTPKGRDTCRIPCLRIRDYPRFGWRGMHLDVGRHFFPPDQVKQFIDQLARHKFNTFHWHLTEDQGWRIEIKKYPKLTSVGAYRKESPKHGNRRQGDGKPYGGFYTQEQVKDIVAYAKERFITVVPEIELPGHAQASIAAYPWLGNTKEQLEVRTRWGVSRNVYNVEERTFEFLQDVLTEVLELFPSEFIHIGGDECPKQQWKQSAAAQKRIKELGLKDEHELQSWFIRRIEKFLTSKGRRLIGWDEIQEGGLAPNATMMVWRSWDYGIKAVRQGHDIVMSPTSHCYFDYYQGDPAHEPEAIGGLLPLRKVYDFEPVSEQLTRAEAKHVLGAQGNLWTEYIWDWDKLMYMAWPRACAMAEVTWSPSGRKDYDDFLARWNVHAKRFDLMNVAYRIPAPQPKVAAAVFRQTASVTFHPPGGDGVIRFTMDGSLPTAASPELNDAIVVRNSTKITAATFLPSGRHSAPSAVDAIRFEAKDPGPLEPGLWLEIHRGRWNKIPDFSRRQANSLEKVNTIGLGHGEPADRFGLRFLGFLKITEAGNYNFTTTSDDGSDLWLAGARIVNNDGSHGRLSRSGTVHLEAGTYPLEVRYFDAGGANSLDVFMAGPGIDKAPIPKQMLWRQPR